LIDLNNPTPVVSAVRTLTGANVDFAIPRGARKIIVTVAGVSTNGVNSIGIQLSVGGVFASTLYLASVDTIIGSSAPSLATAAFAFAAASGPTSIFHTTAELNLQDPDTWLFTQSSGGSNGAYNLIGNGSRAMGGVVDGLRLLAFGGDVFDAGTAQVTASF
jgi:hypothetical protein